MKLFNNFTSYKDRIALFNNNTNITYQEILDLSLKQKKILSKKPFLFIIATNSFYPIITYISSILNNHKLILVDSKMNFDELIKLIRVYKPSHIVSPEHYKNKSQFQKFKVLDLAFNYVILKTNYLDQKINNKISILLPTSGSMGSPKFAMLSNKNIKRNADDIIKYLDINLNDRAITSMPFSYSYMLSILNTHLEKGASVYISENSIMQREFWTNLKRNKITSLSGIPYMYNFFLKLGLNKIYCKSLKTFTQAGGNLDKKSKERIINFCKSKKMKFIVMYGQTEASPRISYLDWKYALKKNGSIGKNIKSTKMWIENENGKKINKSGMIGEIIFKGDNVFIGYAYNREDLKKKNYKKKILKTGDLGYFDKDGFFYITGRSKRIAKVFGVRIALEELERKMKKHGHVVVCKNIANKIKIYYEKKYKKNSIIKLANHFTGQNKNIFECNVIDKIPRTSFGKIDYSKLN